VRGLNAERVQYSDHVADRVGQAVVGDLGRAAGTGQTPACPGR
jgi:hypothetical protein